MCRHAYRRRQAADVFETAADFVRCAAGRVRYYAASHQGEVPSQQGNIVIFTGAACTACRRGDHCSCSTECMWQPQRRVASIRFGNYQAVLR